MTFGKRFSGLSTAGRAEDLGDTWFRSMWERNFARFLKFTGERFEYEKHTFWFPVRRGTASYKPDFKSLDKPNTWYEVKGYLDARSRVALDRMRRYFPNETVVLIDAAWFSAAHRQGLHKLIPHWESLRKNRIKGFSTNQPGGRHEERTRRFDFDGERDDARESEIEDEDSPGG